MAFNGLRRQGYCIIKTTQNADGSETEELLPGVVLPRVMKLTSSPTSEKVAIYGDDGEAEGETAQGNGGVVVELCNLTVKDQAALGGHAYTEADNSMVCNKDDRAPFCRCASIVPGVRNNVPFFRVVTFLRVKFSPVGEDYETKGKSVAYKTPSLSGEFSCNKDGNWRDTREFATVDAAITYFETMINLTKAAV